MQDNPLQGLHEAQLRAATVRRTVQQFMDKATSSRQRKNKHDSSLIRRDIHAALSQLSEVLANGYAQVKIDLQDEGRLSWAGTAHEIREVLATMLQLMSPDAQVTARPWYKQETNSSRPTQKQRVRYILEQQSAGSKEREVVEQVTYLEDRIGNLVRATYSRASDAAHRSKNRREVIRIVNYFEAFADDLLNLG